MRFAGWKVPRRRYVSACHGEKPLALDNTALGAAVALEQHS